MEKESDEVERYVETIYRKHERGERARTSDISKALRLSPPSVTEMFRRLKKKGLVHYSPRKGVLLTKKGEGIGRRLVRKHRLVERFLSFIGVRKKIHREASSLEHVISDDVENAIDSLIGYPEKSLTGKTIPRKRRKKERHIVPLTKMKKMQKGRVAFMAGSRDVAQRLADMGLAPNTKVEVLRRSPYRKPIELLVRRSKVSISRGIAGKIFVEVKKGDKG
jgi:DtxR family Mn-dependent transcriptional regulator